MFIGLNPSTADEAEDDPTIRRCINFAKDWGYGKYVMLNLFAYRSTDPSVLWKRVDPIGRENDHWIKKMCQQADIVIAAWGAHQMAESRGEDVCTMLAELKLSVKALKLTKFGSPSHPLYLPKNLLPFPYEWRP